MKTIRYTKGDELEGIDITWPEPDGSLYDFSSGWSFRARIGNPGQAALAEKTTGFAGGSTAPNLVISWAATELDAVPSGSYHLDITATVIATNQDLTYTLVFQILDRVLAAAP